MAFALFPHDQHYHLLRRASAYVTLCGLPVKGRVQEVQQRLPPAVVTIKTPLANYAICEACHAVRGLKILTRLQKKKPPD